MFKFLGLPYPLMPTAKGYLPTVYGLDTLRSDLLILLLTNPGERVMLPGFGTPLRELIHEPNDTILEDVAKTMISTSITNWEPRVTIDAIDVTSQVESNFLSPDDDQSERERVLGIKILFLDPQDIKEVQELVLEVPLN